MKSLAQVPKLLTQKSEVNFSKVANLSKRVHREFPNVNLSLDFYGGICGSYEYEEIRKT